MSRQQGSFNFSSSLEPNIKGPLDSRESVDIRRDLTLESTWNKGDGVWVWPGMTVSVTKDPHISNNGLYMLMGADWANESSWKYIGNYPDAVPIISSNIQPSDKDAIWIDDTKPINISDSQLVLVLKKLDEAVQRIQDLEYTLQFKLDAGGFDNSIRNDESKLPALRPLGDRASVGVLDEVVDEGLEPTTIEPTVKHMCVKRGTKAAAMKYRPLDGELAVTTDTQSPLLYVGLDGKFKLVSGGGGGPVDPEDPNLNGVMEYIDLQVEGASKIYRVRVDENGALKIYDRRVETETVPPITNEEKGLEVLKGLTISMVYGGGEDSDHTSYNPCSHSFIELHNNSLSGQDINLNGMSLQYCGENGTNWKVLKLKGIIPYMHCFTIRCAPCSDVNVNTTRIIVDDYDQDWKDLRISNTKFKLFLTIGTTKCLKENPMTKGIETTVFTDGYVDQVGAQNPSVASGNSIDGFESFPFKKLTPNRGCLRTYVAEFNKTDPKKGTVGGDTNNNLVDFRVIDFTMDVDVRDTAKTYKPWSVKRGAKTIYYNKTTYRADQPNMVSVTFGKNPNTTRCFNWISIGYHNESLQYRLKGSSEWKVSESINISPITESNLHLAVHNRQRMIGEDGTRYTVHKVIVNSLVARQHYTDIYEYRVGRDGCWSDIYEFKLKYYDPSTPFSILHITDQQGWTWEEYQPWRHCAKQIKKKHINPDLGKDFDLIINTGDATQNGNRPNEWMDYWEAGQDLLPYYPIAYTMGNNDLGPEVGDVKGKTNPALLTNFFTYEYDADNIPFLPDGQAWDRTDPKQIDKHLMRSVYSFTLGNTHFISINTYCYVEQKGDNDTQEYWFRNDVEKARRDPNVKWIIVITHDAPFSVVTNKEKKRTCRLNRDNPAEFPEDAEYPAERKYRWSRIFEEYGVDMVLAGHKHTYARSKPVRERVVDGIVQPNEPYMDETASANGHTDVTNPNGVIYICNQATGFKLSSNKEIPGDQAVNQWCAKYFATVNGGVNAGQYQPTYITIDFAPRSEGNASDYLQMKSWHVKGTMQQDPKTMLYSIYDQYNPADESKINIEEMDTMKVTKTT
ncbi:MAG: metallophosphoesterase [Bacteroidales bacterium]